MRALHFPSLSSSSSRIHLQSNAKARKGIQSTDSLGHSRYCASSMFLVDDRIITLIQSEN